MGKARERVNRRKQNRGVSKVYIIGIAILSVLFVGILSLAFPIVLDVQADNTKCEDGKTCYIAEYVGNGNKENKKDQCRATENNNWQWKEPLESCGKKKKPAPPTATPFKPDPPDTPVPDVPDTPVPDVPDLPDEPEKPTEGPGDPVPTEIPDDPSDKPEPTKDTPPKDDVPDKPRPDDPPDKDAPGNPTPTPAVQSIETYIAPECQWCEMGSRFLSLFERLVISNERQANTFDLIATQMSE